MTYANLKQRQEVIAGLRDLADFLAIQPEVPAPTYVNAYVFPPMGTDAAMRADVRLTAFFLDTEPEEDEGHYRASKAFGPVTFRITAISSDQRARYQAWRSYDNAVTPDSTTERR